MSDKKCPKCGETKNIKQFYKGQVYCKPCQLEYNEIQKRKKFNEVFNIIKEMCDKDEIVL